MRFGHQYELIKEGGGDGDIKDELQPPRSTPIISSWWKLALCNLLAAIAGAGVTFLIARSSFGNQHSSITPNTASAALSTSLSTDLPLSSSAAEQAKGESSSPNMAPGEILDCGWSLEEARAKNCVYDVMMQDWVPEPCYDAALTERYLAKGNWTWYADGDGQTIISDEQMRKGEHGSAWMATSYHHAHCVFSWVKLIRALRNNKGISQELLSYDHVLHCSHGALMENPKDEGLGVRAPTNYAKCALYDTWHSNFLPDKHNSTQR